MDHRQARRMDRLRLASATRTNHLPQRNGSLPNHRRWQSPRKCVETLVRKQGPITPMGGCLGKLEQPVWQTTAACGYGSRIGARSARLSGTTVLYFLLNG